MFNSGPLDGLRRCRQSSLRSEVTSLSFVCLYCEDTKTNFHEIEIKCSLKAFIDSTSVISNAVFIHDLIPKRQYPNNADCMPTVKDYASRVISRMRLAHVNSHQDTKTNFDKLPFAAQLNTILCDRMATRHLEFHRDGKCAAQSDLLATRNILCQSTACRNWRRHSP